jgi:chromosome segregation ATPase
MLVAIAIAFIIGLVIGLRGCGSGSASKLLQENAALKQEVENQRFLAKQAEELRAAHAARRNAAERELEAAEEREAEAASTVATLRKRVKAERKKRDARDELIDALDKEMEASKTRAAFLSQALDAAKLELEQSYQIENALNAALRASEQRADKLEKHVGKSRRHKIAIGIGSAAGGAVLTLGAVAAAGRLQ